MAVIVVVAVAGVAPAVVLVVVVGVVVGVVVVMVQTEIIGQATNIPPFRHPINIHMFRQHASFVQPTAIIHEMSTHRCNQC